jgi:membrane-associated protease RseP (regulator of RpoE activity)
MQKQYRLLLQALLVAACLVIGMSAALYAADEGLVIVAVDDQGPAAKAGIVRGDILLAIDETPVNTMADLMTALAGVEAGATVTLQVQHGDVVKNYTVETGQQGPRAYLGLRPYGAADVVMPQPPDGLPWRGEQGMPPDRMPMPAALAPQLIVAEVMTDSAAAEAGLQVKDVITAINGETISDPRLLKKQLAALEPGDTITVTVMRGADESVDLTATLGEDQKGGAILGVKLAVVAAFDAQHAGEAMPRFMPAPPEPEAPFYWRREDGGARGRRFFFWREGPGDQNPRFFRFHRFAPPPFYFFSAPPPDWMRKEEFIQSQEGFTMAYPAYSEQMWLAPPVGGEAQIEIRQGSPALQEAEVYY